MTKQKRQPKATRHGQTPNSTTWEIKFPSTMKKDGATYWATTYPNSDLVYVTTGARHRPVSKNVGRKLIPTIKAAIDAAIKSELPLTERAKTPLTKPQAMGKTEDMSGLKALFDAVPPIGDIDAIKEADSG